MNAGPDDHRGSLEQRLATYRPQFEALANAQGLDYHPVAFELVPATFLMEVAVYGLPVRMPHWSFGVRYIHQYVQHRMGHSRIFEVVFPGNPNRAYLQESNALSDNVLVTAHVLGHADFSKNNALFERMQREAGERIVEQAAARARRIEDVMQAHGHERVEQVLDAALALEQHVDIGKPLHRPPYPEWIEAREYKPAATAFETRYHTLPGERPPAPPASRERAPLPPAPEADLLWFIARYAPDLDDWERDIFLAVREESYYFYPLFACQVMNEGWASFWHARLLRKADFLPADLYLDAIKAHSDVVSPYAGDEQVALAINPYHLGFRIWEEIVERHGLETAFRVRSEEDDFGFIRNHLSLDLARELNLFAYTRERAGASEERIRVHEFDLDELREILLAPKFNYGAPRIRVRAMRQDGALELVHAAEVDGRGLDLERANKVLEYIHRVWRRPVRLDTVNADGSACALEAPD